MDGPGTYSQPPQAGGSKDESGTAAKDTISIGSGDCVSGADRMGMEVHEILELSLPRCLNDRHAAESCLSWYRKSGRVKSVHGAFISVDPSDGDKELTQLSRKRCHESCAQAVSLGAENVVFHSSCAPFLREGYLDYWADSCASFYEEHGVDCGSLPVYLRKLYGSADAG